MANPPIGPNGFPRWDKAPASVLDYGFDWQLWLDTGDTLASSTWTVPDDLSKVAETHDTDQTTVWISGGVLGRVYQITNTITTTGGRTIERTLELHIWKT